MGLLVFKTSVPVTSWRVGSIPMHFRHFFDIKGLQLFPIIIKISFNLANWPFFPKL